MKKIILKIQRYSPEKNISLLQSYEISVRDELTVLDALNEIKNTRDESLAYRWSCRMGICGSCGMMVNGKPVLTCSTYLRDLATEVVTVEPLRNFPVIKDLVVDIDNPMEKMRSVFPYISIAERNGERTARARRLNEGATKSVATEVKDELYYKSLQTPKQLQKIKQSSQCIKCMLCYSACPVYGENKKFVGPAAAALAFRYQQDSRETSKLGKDRRMDRMTAINGVFDCSFVGECSKVCPKRVDPAMAIQWLKIMGALHLGKKIFTK